MNEALSFSTGEFEKRIERTQGLMAEKELDGLIAISDSGERGGHVAYLTNHRLPFGSGPARADRGINALLLPAEGKGTLVSPMGYEKGTAFCIDEAKTGPNFVTDLLSAIRESRLDGKRIGLAGLDVLPCEYFDAIRQALPETTFEKANDLLESQRALKTDKETALLRRAAQVSDKGLLAGMEAARVGVREFEVELAARAAALDAGADFISLVRVSSGPTIPSPDRLMTAKKKIESGDLVTLSLAGWTGGYGFNNSRIRVAGKPNDEQADFLEHLADAVEWMAGNLKPGEVTGFVFTFSRERQVLPRAHGIGLDLWEKPSIEMADRINVAPRTVLSLEPIVKSPLFGETAIKDTVVVTDAGVEVLNRSPRVFS